MIKLWRVADRTSQGKLLVRDNEKGNQIAGLAFNPVLMAAMIFFVIQFAQDRRTKEYNRSQDS